MGFKSGSDNLSRLTVGPGATEVDSIKYNIRSDPAAVITVLSTDYCIVVTAANTQAVTVNLEAAATAGAGRVLQITSGTDRSGEGDITIEAAGSETIDGALTATGFQGVNVSLTIICDGTTWWKI